MTVEFDSRQVRIDETMKRERSQQQRRQLIVLYFSERSPSSELALFVRTLPDLTRLDFSSRGIASWQPLIPMVEIRRVSLLIQSAQSRPVDPLEIMGRDALPRRIGAMCRY